MAKRAALWGMLLLALSASTADARTWNVRKDGTGDYTAIQPAVDGASPGDTILVGPGRYLEHSPFWPGLPAAQEKSWPKETFVAVRVDSLTIRGVDREQVIIGPVQPNYSIEGPLGIVNLAVGKALTISDLRVENVFDGCYLFGRVRIERCIFQGTGHGVAYWDSDGILLSECTFNFNSYGVVAYPGAANPVVSGSSFFSNEAGVDLSNTQNGLVTGCTFVGNLGGVQFEQGTTGTISNCTFNERYFCISMIGPGAALVTNNVCQGNERYSIIGDGQVTATGNVFRGGGFATILLCDTTSRLHGNHIIRGAGLAVQVLCSGVPPVVTVDLSGNYWGTTSADSIRAWIQDHADDPNVYGQVNFEPFSPTPLPTEKKSLGGVKGLYR